jgi:short-subunit dehydrogenase
MKLNGKTALVTGASSGIGEAFARELASKGCNLVITARSVDKLSKLQAELIALYSIKVHVIPVDLVDPGSAQQLYNECRKRGLQVDILVNNAGFGKWTRFLEGSLDSYEEMIQLNMTSIVRLSYLFLPEILKSGNGGIINIASTGSFQPCPYIALYCATKAFVLSFSEALYGEYDKKGVTVTAICPGNTQTNFFSIADAKTKGMSFDPPSKVARDGLNAFLANKNYKVIGFANYLSSLSARFFPRRMMINIAGKMFQDRVSNK